MDIFGPQLQGYQTENPLRSMADVQTIFGNQQIQQKNALMLQQQQQEMQQTNALMQAVRQPGVINQETGELTPHGRNALMGVAPMVAPKLIQTMDLARQERTKSQVNELQAGMERLKINKMGAEALADAYTGMSQAFKSYKAQFPNSSDQEAENYVNEKIRPDLEKGLKTGATLPPEVTDKLGGTFRYKDNEIALAAALGHAEMLKRQDELSKQSGKLSTHPVGSNLETFLTVPEGGQIVQRPVFSAPNPALMRAEAAQAGAGADKFKNIQSDDKGGFVGFNPATGRMEQIPTGAGVTSKASAAVVKEDQRRLDKIAKDYNIPAYKTSEEIADRAETQLSDPSKGYRSVTPEQARALVNQAKLMMDNYRSRTGGKYQDEQVNRMNSLIGRVGKYMETIGEGEKILAKDEMMNLAREMKTIYADRNADLLRNELNIAHSTGKKGGDTSTLTMQGRINDAIRYGKAQKVVVDGKEYLVFGEKGKKVSPDDMYELP